MLVQSHPSSPHDSRANSGRFVQDKFFYFDLFNTQPKHEIWECMKVTVTQKTVPMFATFDFLPLYLHN